MLKDPIKDKEVKAIPRSLQSEWDHYTASISEDEKKAIINWISSQFDEVANRTEKVQPSGWLGSKFKWDNTPLMPIYRECTRLMEGFPEEEIQEKAGQIFGLYVSLTLAEHRDEPWMFVKGDHYKSKGVPIRSRIYFLGEDE
ncbi:hypothetical protein [Gracilimonas sp.]|uniref:hypothetical protein n=1 Tax=Gracilimonas sp. TaxID=1974203 RepID=UPI0032EF7959